MLPTLSTHIRHGKDLTELLHGTIRACLDSPKPDAVLSIESHFFNAVLIADCCEFNLDVGKELWLNKGRWTRLMREYVPHDNLVRFMGQAREIVGGKSRSGATANLLIEPIDETELRRNAAGMLFRDPKRAAKKHRWGGCLMGATFHMGHECGPGKYKGQITFFSRTTYIGYMGLLDAAIAHVLARHIGDPKDIAFRWVISSMQLHCFKTLPFIFSQPDLYKRLNEYRAQLVKVGVDRFKKLTISPTWYHIVRWYDKLLLAFDKYGVDMLAHEKYGAWERIKRRWLEHERHLDKNVPPTLKVQTLSFEKAHP